MFKMKAAFAIFFFAAAILPLSSAIMCPIGELVDNKTRFSGGLLECFACVEYQCGQEAVQYGCSDGALKACPTFEGKISEHAAATTAYCKKEDDGKISYYFPACKDSIDYDACKRTRNFAVAFLTLMNTCNGLNNTADHMAKLDFNAFDVPTGPSCPMGERKNGVKDADGNPKQTCSSCVEYQCGHKEVQYGCPENAFKECPELKANVSKDVDVWAYCKKKIDGSISFYIPACKGKGAGDKCPEQPDYELAYQDFTRRCIELYEEEDLKKKNDYHGKVRCPRKRSLDFDQSADYEVFCRSCAIYKCKADEVAGMGCTEDFDWDCPEFQQEILDIKAHLPFGMFYCNDNVFFLSGCEGQKSAAECMINGTALRTAVEITMKSCEGREAGSDFLAGPPKDEL